MIAGFFRHGPAVPRGTKGVAEAERSLTPEGRKKTLRAARGVRRLDLGFDGLYSSPLPRAIQTAEILGTVLGLPAPKELEALRPESTAAALLKTVRGLRGTPLLVGHEPLLSQTVGRAAGASLELKKAGLVVVDLGAGTLLLLLPPSVLRRLGRSPAS